MFITKSAYMYGQNMLLYMYLFLNKRSESILVLILVEVNVFTRVNALSAIRL